MGPPPRRVKQGQRGQRGQAHTLEAVVGAIRLLTAVGFALQITIVTPLSASTSSQHIESQQRATAQGVLATAAEEGALKDAVLYWNDTGGNFHDTSVRNYYTNGPPDNEFGNMLSRAFDQNGLAYNVYLRSNAPRITNIQRQRMIFQGTPSDNAISASRTIVLHEDDLLLDNESEPTGTELNDSSTFSQVTTDADGVDQGVYNVVRVEVVVWRI